MDSIINFATLKEWAPGTFVALIILLMLSDQLILKPRLIKAEKERDEWKGLALGLLGVADRMTTANEVAVKTIDSKLPPTDLVTEALQKVIAPKEAKGRRDT